MKIKDSPQMSSCWLFFETIIMMHGTMNVKSHEGVVNRKVLIFKDFIILRFERI